MDYLIDNVDATVMLEVCDNADGENIIVNLTSDEFGSVGIALSAEQVFTLVDELRMLAAGI